MACGGCQQRAEAIRAGAIAIANGDRAELDRQIQAFTASAKDDAAKVTRAASNRIGSALARLGARRG